MIEPTKVFISWSGDRSRVVAEKLRDWLPLVLNNVTPWMSKADIDAGARWSQELDQQLGFTSYGILCVTKSNTTAPWLMYEAGAIAKSIADGAVVPYLIDLQPAEIPAGPLGRFQAKRANKDETWEIVERLNIRQGAGGIEREQLRKRFDAMFPDLDTVLQGLPQEAGQVVVPSTDDMLKEVLETVRELARNSTPKFEPTLYYSNPADPQITVYPSSFSSKRSSVRDVGKERTQAERFFSNERLKSAVIAALEAAPSGEPQTVDQIAERLTGARFDFGDLNTLVKTFVQLEQDGQIVALPDGFIAYHPDSRGPQ